MYVRKDNYLTYDGESYKRIDDENKSITWNDGSKSLYGQRINLFDRLKPYIVFGMFGGLFIYVFFVEWKIRRKYKTSKTTPASSQTRYKQEWLFILINKTYLFKRVPVLFHFSTFNDEIISICCITVGWVKCFFIIFVEEILFTKFLNVFIDKVKEFFVTF